MASYTTASISDPQLGNVLLNVPIDCPRIGWQGDLPCDPNFPNRSSSRVAAIAYLGAEVWPNGPVCHNCGETNQIGKLNGKTTRLRLLDLRY
jgi:hypothetical protein